MTRPPVFSMPPVSPEVIPLPRRTDCVVCGGWMNCEFCPVPASERALRDERQGRLADRPAGRTGAGGDVVTLRARARR